MSDIVERLYIFAESFKRCFGVNHESILLNDAKSEILRLREENARLLAALKPFGEALKDNYYHQIDALPIVAGSNQMDIRFKWTLGDLRAAAADIREGDKDE